eukprot:6201322-Pleurochrysis_carterae.AAC.1
MRLVTEFRHPQAWASAPFAANICLTKHVSLRHVGNVSAACIGAGKLISTVPENGLVCVDLSLNDFGPPICSVLSSVLPIAAPKVGAARRTPESFSLAHQHRQLPAIPLK